jgi:hypothetical protein
VVLTAVLAGLGGLTQLAKEELAERSVRDGAFVGAGLVLVVAVLMLGLWWLQPGVDRIVKLEGDLTVAILPFATAGDDGQETTRGFLEDLSRGIESQVVERAEQSLGSSSFVVGVRRMDYPLDLGAPRPALEAEVAELARKSNASFLLTGVVDFRQSTTAIQPMLYVSSTRVPDAPELAGWYDGAESTVVRGDPRMSVAVRGPMYEGLGVAMATLLRFGVALELITLGQQDQAVRDLESIEHDGDFRIVPRELAALFVGNAVGRTVCGGDSACRSSALDRAEAAYQRSIAAAGSGDSARGRVGLAEVALQRGQGGDCSPNQVHDADLQVAESTYRGVVDDPVAPLLAQAKARLGLVRVGACRAVAGTGDGAGVRELTDGLVQQYRAGEESVAHLAAEARSFDAITAWVQQRPHDAVTALEEAIELAVSSPPARRAWWLSLLAEYSGSQPVCDTERARQAVAKAIDTYNEIIPTASGAEHDDLEAGLRRAQQLEEELHSKSGCG